MICHIARKLSSDAKEKKQLYALFNHLTVTFVRKHARPWTLLNGATVAQLFYLSFP